MRRNYKFRIYPSKKQERKLFSHLEICRKLYNELRDDRILAYQTNQKSLSRFDQIKSITTKKSTNTELKEVYIDILQDVATRVNTTFTAFFGRVKKKNTKAGFPRFKKEGSYRSLGVPDFKKSSKLQDNRIKIPKIGLVKIKQHRSIVGDPKSLTVKFDGLRWFAIISSDLTGVKRKKKKSPKKPKTIGIDVGVQNFATFSSGDVISNPRYLKQYQKKIDKANKQKKDLVKKKLWKKVQDKRSDFTHKESLNIVRKYDIICVENIEVNKLIEGNKKWHCKNLTDSTWGLFFQKLLYKAESAGKTIVKVNPAYTSQDCSNCGNRQFKDLKERIHSCKCGFSTSRDHNAAINILRLGLQSLGVNP